MKPPEPGVQPGPAPRSAGRYLESLWYGPPGRGWFLVPLGWLFNLVVALRRAAYRAGLLATIRLPVPVIVVGNVTVGGTGKTPVVAWLACWLRDRGHRPGVLSRGYGGNVGRGPRLVVDADEADLVGDEPLLLQRETGVPVAVGSDRIAAAQLLLAQGVDVIISDDGLQHYRLGRDLELAVVDGARRLGNGRLLPAGPLREPASRLGQVDLVLVNGEVAAAGAPSGGTGKEARFHLVGPMAVLPDGSDGQPLESFRGDTVRMLAGIGNPDRFRRLLESAGLVVGQSLAVDDHGRVGEAMLRSAGPPIFMTSKDAVKYRLPADGSIRVVPVTAAMPAFLDQWLEQWLHRRPGSMPARPPSAPEAPPQRGIH